MATGSTHAGTGSPTWKDLDCTCTSLRYGLPPDCALAAAGNMNRARSTAKAARVVAIRLISMPSLVGHLTCPLYGIFYLGLSMAVELQLSMLNEDATRVRVTAAHRSAGAGTAAI
jgi:hypothetical protein